MSTTPRPLAADDEQIHPWDPADWSWNESWFFSFIDLDGGPAGFFRLGLLPNQGRAMLWCFVHVDRRWLAVEDGHLRFEHVETTHGVGYDRWNQQVAWRPSPPLEGARFTFRSEMLIRSGPGAGGYLPVVVDLACRATGAAVLAREGGDGSGSGYEDNRFEQPLEASGTVEVDGIGHAVRAGAHRDRAWGPRDWRQLFAMGDLQAPDRQLFFVGRTFPGIGMGFVRDGRARFCASGAWRGVS